MITGYWVKNAAGNATVSLPHLERVGCALSTGTGQVLRTRWGVSSPGTRTSVQGMQPGPGQLCAHPAAAA